MMLSIAPVLVHSTSAAGVHNASAAVVHQAATPESTRVTTTVRRGDYLVKISQSPDGSNKKMISQVFSPVKKSPAAPAGGDPIYMNFGGTTGDVTANGYAGDIQLLSFAWGVSNSAPSASSVPRGSGAPSISEITITKAVDKASPQLLQDTLIGQPQDVKIFFVNSVQGRLNTYAEYDLRDVLISGYSVSSGGDRPTESLSLNFTKVQFTSVVPNANGTTSPVTTGWDLSTGEVDGAMIPLRIAVPPGTDNVSIADGQVVYDGITVPLAGADGVVISTGNGNLVVNIDGPVDVPIGLDSGAGVKTVNVRSGVATFGTDIGVGADVNLHVYAGAGVTFGATQHLTSLSIDNNGSAAFAAGSRNVLFTSGLTIGGTGSSLGTLDLADSDLVLGYSRSSPYDSVRQWVQARTITGRGIFSSTAPASPASAIGLVDNASIRQTIWDGQTVSDGSNYNQILTKRTLRGDTNLDGKVDQQDYLNIIANMGRAGATYFEGDLDEDGVVTTNDLAIVSANLGAAAN
ncbi:MAG: type VI secretion system tube protein Hcp [Tepidisphaerales bacterium]